jgi:ribonucleoside-diphosphate reductase alpha chain
MCGTGVGFSVERQFIAKLPVIADEFHHTESVIKVHDSKIGWAAAFRELISLLYSGQIPKWDMSNVRAAGVPLKTFGGRASGPEPLESLFKFCISVFKSAAGRRLTSIECHDIMTKVAEVVVVGGVRRSATISLSNLSDDRMRHAKTGQWWLENPQRALANNSVAYTEKPDMLQFMQEWQSLYESKSGERGIFNRHAIHRKCKKLGRRKWEGVNFLTNPCSEISLACTSASGHTGGQVCNLTEVVIRHDDTLDTLKEKVRLATILGTYQSSLTNFRYVRKSWQKITEEERLLGVSLTGIMDHYVMSGKAGPETLKAWLTELKEHAIKVNAEWADKIGINHSVSITTVKP